MADYLVLHKQNGARGPEGWKVLALKRDRPLTQAGATEALRESYQGPGRYAILRADNARTVTIEANPAIVDDASPEF